MSQTWSKLEVSVSPFEIDKKITHNNLKFSQRIIEEHSIFSPDISEKYSAFDREGVNKSRSVIHTISRFYIDLAIEGKGPDEIFFGVVDKVADFAIESGNFVYASKELVQLSAEILTVDTFLRCKIFEEPPIDVTT